MCLCVYIFMCIFIFLISLIWWWAPSLIPYLELLWLVLQSTCQAGISETNVGLLDHIKNLFLLCWEISILFSMVAALICIPTVHKCSPFSTSMPAFVTFCLLDESHSHMGKMISYQVLVCISLHGWWYWTFFHKFGGNL